MKRKNGIATRADATSRSAGNPRAQRIAALKEGAAKTEGTAKTEEKNRDRSSGIAPMRAVSSRFVKFVIPNLSDSEIQQPIQAGVKPTPTKGYPTRWIGAGFIPDRKGQMLLQPLTLESINLGNNLQGVPKASRQIVSGLV